MAARLATEWKRSSRESGIWIGMSIAALVLFLATPAVANEITGYWLVKEKEAVIHIVPAGDGLSGTIVWIKSPLDRDDKPRRDRRNPDKELRDRTIVGLEILKIEPVDPEKKKRQGTIYDPKSGITYKCKLRLRNEDQIVLRGYVGVSVIGKTTRWTRVKGIPLRKKARAGSSGAASKSGP